MRRSGSLGHARRGDCKHPQLPRSVTDCVQVVRVVPEHLVDYIRNQQTRIFRDWIRAIEVKNLQSRSPSDRQKLSRRRHPIVSEVARLASPSSSRFGGGHIFVCAGRTQLAGSVHRVGCKLIWAYGSEIAV